MILETICKHFSELCQISTDVAIALRTAHIISIGNLTPLGAVCSTLLMLVISEIVKERLQQFLVASPLLFVVAILLAAIFYAPQDIYLGLTTHYFLALIIAFMEQKLGDNMLPFALIFLVGILGFMIIEHQAGKKVPDIALILLSIALVGIVAIIISSYPPVFPIVVIVSFILFMMNHHNVENFVAEVIAKSLVK